MAHDTMPLQEILKHLERLANDSLPLWPVPEGATARLINVSENATYLVEAGEFRSVLRIHRPAYHSRRGIGQELAWARALSDSGMVLTPPPIAGRNGDLVQEGRTPGLPEPRFMVMFQFAEGRQPDENEDLVAPFEGLGAIAARTHIHSQTWQKPEPLERLVWDTDAVFGPRANWGNWRDAPNVTPAVREVLEQVETTICARLAAFGKGADRYGLIHADMRLANLLIDGETTRLIDFDDCGLGWFLYDFAAGISFMEDHPQVPALRAAWVKGYRSVRALSDDEEREIDTFIMLRRMALLAWIGSHIEAPEPQAMAPHFARVSAELGRAYLAKFAPA
ncbi:phosphotransferase enzyme family protein [Pseudogemmobacter humi]|uniref:Serine/threonine protein kinase n=1 Tax=Pseudogemmobacter humi TaxID=2483812 RepID=A0A3P5X7U2_9RHOB|nr:phosphotransferase [Pseudogemmobacter humi]VDC23414.1 serine/threonine protein kinase [Pseudogemmobacter humi]